MAILVGFNGCACRCWTSRFGLVRDRVVANSDLINNVTDRRPCGSHNRPDESMKRVEKRGKEMVQVCCRDSTQGVYRKAPSQPWALDAKHKVASPNWAPKGEHFSPKVKQLFRAPLLPLQNIFVPASVRRGCRCHGQGPAVTRDRGGYRDGRMLVIKTLFGVHDDTS